MRYWIYRSLDLLLPDMVHGHCLGSIARRIRDPIVLEYSLLSRVVFVHVNLSGSRLHIDPHLPTWSFAAPQLTRRVRT